MTDAPVLGVSNSATGRRWRLRAGDADLAREIERQLELPGVVAGVLAARVKSLEEAELSPRKLAVRFTDTQGYFVSEASVYRLLKAHDLITSPAFIVIKAADEFTDKSTAPNQMWQTDFTYPKVLG